MKFKALISLKTTKAGGRENKVVKSYRPSLIIKREKTIVRIDCVFEECESIEPGKSGIATINISNEKLLSTRKINEIAKGLTFDVAEGNKIIGIGIIMEMLT